MLLESNLLNLFFVYCHVIQRSLFSIVIARIRFCWTARTIMKSANRLPMVVSDNMQDRDVAKLGSNDGELNSRLTERRTHTAKEGIAGTKNAPP